MVRLVRVPLNLKTCDFFIKRKLKSKKWMRASEARSRGIIRRQVKSAIPFQERSLTRRARSRNKNHEKKRLTVGISSF